MSENFGSPSPIQPLSVGNVVSAAVRLYRSHLKEYFLLALKAYVWVLLPVYGWAKFYALSALISRLAYGELVNQPESISSGERFVNSRLWQFLVTMLLMFLIGIGIGLGVLVLFVLFGFFSAFVGLGLQGNSVTSIFIVILTIVLSIAAIVAVLWLLTRFYLVDVPLAIEDNVDGISTISRSWQLTQGNVWRILLISFVGFLITIPAQIVLQIISAVIQGIFSPLINENSTIFTPIFLVLILGLSFSTGAIILPFGQAIKAVIYYDMRSRREGLGLKLRDREI
ncbi:DUF975 domain-containing protein [Nostoc flagelliforme FACHB-838]|uniref:DUF975 domain-containing protein n=1 Tax=Nostoc flagelliforme FACHB-838 TaxID=2692904 RepID=A0ABR8DNJ9_9NOSO|nr:DUF975 domain-containing protein [Nostoc flagelliforme]MBD2530486.1 DUF975 domain-containing protein [Nostoc flagelliforme FACHB-838]